MFGQNIPRGRDAAQTGDTLEVIGKPFLTIQGEGPFSGERAVFVRLAHCNLACTFCDTEFTEGAATVDTVKLAHDVSHVAFSVPGRAPLVVITGGEPLRQPLRLLIQALGLRGLRRVQIETAGTLPAQVFGSTTVNVTYVVSPKTARLHSSFERVLERTPTGDDLDLNQVWLKYVVRAGDPLQSTQPGGRGGRVFPPPDAWPVHRVFVQPCDERLDVTTLYSPKQETLPDHTKNRENLEAAASLALLHGYRLSVQVHKLANMP